MSAKQYILALGSNQRHHRYGRPRAVIMAAVDALSKRGVKIIARAPIISSRPIGPSQRLYANSAVLVESALAPQAVLALCQAIERDFGRVRRGQKWRARVLDIDLVLWSGGRWTSDTLTLPHPHYTQRRFVLGPAASIAPDWRDPASGWTLRQLRCRQNRRAKKGAASAMQRP